MTAQNTRPRSFRKSRRLRVRGISNGVPAGTPTINNRDRALKMTKGTKPNVFEEEVAEEGEEAEDESFDEAEVMEEIMSTDEVQNTGEEDKYTDSPVQQSESTETETGSETEEPPETESEEVEEIPPFSADSTSSGNTGSKTAGKLSKKRANSRSKSKEVHKLTKYTSEDAPPSFDEGLEDFESEDVQAPNTSTELPRDTPSPSSPPQTQAPNISPTATTNAPTSPPVVTATVSPTGQPSKETTSEPTPPTTTEPPEQPLSPTSNPYWEVIQQPTRIPTITENPYWAVPGSLPPSTGNPYWSIVGQPSSGGDDATNPYWDTPDNVPNSLVEWDCPSDIVQFQSTIQVDFVGSPESLTDEEISSLERTIATLYNTETLLLCDTYVRTIMDVELQQGRGGYVYDITATCRDCPKDTTLLTVPLITVASTRNGGSDGGDSNNNKDEYFNKVLETYYTSSVSHSYYGFFEKEDHMAAQRGRARGGRQPKEGRLRHRAMQAMNTCFCPADVPPTAPQAPTEEEFLQIQNEAIDQLRSAGILTSIESVSRLEEQ